MYHNFIALVVELVDTKDLKSAINRHPFPEDDPLQCKPDITVDKKKINWTPKISKDDGL
jgi:hypothetical protein